MGAFEERGEEIRQSMQLVFVGDGLQEGWRPRGAL